MVDGMGLASEWSADLKVGGNVVEPGIIGRPRWCAAPMISRGGGSISNPGR